mgnify:CR=1 FL=1
MNVHVTANRFCFISFIEISLPQDEMNDWGILAFLCLVSLNERYDSQRIKKSDATNSKKVEKDNEIDHLSLDH